MSEAFGALVALIGSAWAIILAVDLLHETGGRGTR